MGEWFAESWQDPRHKGKMGGTRRNPSCETLARIDVRCELQRRAVDCYPGPFHLLASSLKIRRNLDADGHFAPKPAGPGEGCNHPTDLGAVIP